MAIHLFGRVMQRCRGICCVSGLCAIALAACSGGGGGSSGSVTSGPPTTSPNPTAPSLPAPGPSAPILPSAPSDAEIFRNYGLGTINAPAAYSAGANGNGVTVAIIDSGIDRDNQEFAGRIDSRSIDVVSGTTSALGDTNGHGTHIAGIIGAAANDSGIVGVSPEARILALRANARGDGVGPGELLFFDDDVARAIDRAADSGAKIINLSFGKLEALSGSYEAALARAVARDILIIASAGNDPSGQTTLPASLAGSSEARGRILAVGAVDSSETIAGFSGQPGGGVLNEAFLVAPGVDIRSTAVGGGLETRSGTSFATPHVSGAAAVLKSAFPSLTMRQIGDLLVAAAKDLGPPGADSIYGRGLIDLRAALAPQGGMSLASGNSVAGSSTSLSETELSLGAAFGDALSSSAALDRVMALDAYDRPYSVDLTGQVQRRSPSFQLDDLLIDGPGQHQASMPASFADGSAGLGWQAEETRLWDRGPTGFQQTDQDSAVLHRFDFSGSDQEISWRFGYGLGAGSLVSSAPMHDATADLFWQGSAMTMPESTLIERGIGGATRHRLGERTELVLGMMQSDQMESFDQEDSQADARMFHLGLDHRASERLRLALGFSQVDEDEAFLGSSSDGAFGDDASASTRMMTLRGDYTLGGGFNLFASGTVAQTSIGGDQGMLQDWSAVQSQAFAMGVTRTGVFGSIDRIGLMVGQPLRVSDASATLDVPTSRDLDGNVERSRERVDVAPEGREIDVQLSYRAPLSERFRLGSWLMYRREPGHDAEADDDYAIGLRLDHQF